MPFIPVPNVVEVALVYDMNAQNMRTVLHFTRAGGGPYDLDALEALGAVLNSEWDTYLRSLFTTFVQYHGCTLHALDSETAPSTEVMLDAYLVGTRVGTPPPDNVAFALKKVTGLGGRSFRGRIYHFGFSGGDLADPGHLNAVPAGDMADGYNQFRLHTADESTNSIMGVVSKYHGVANVIVDGRYKRKPVPRDTGIFTPITSISYTDLSLDSQRRRLPGRGT